MKALKVAMKMAAVPLLGLFVLAGVLQLARIGLKVLQPGNQPLSFPGVLGELISTLAISAASIWGLRRLLQRRDSEHGETDSDRVS